jgi:hypothetical protein
MSLSKEEFGNLKYVFASGDKVYQGMQFVSLIASTIAYLCKTQIMQQQKQNAEAH